MALAENIMALMKMLARGREMAVKERSFQKAMRGRPMGRPLVVKPPMPVEGGVKPGPAVLEYLKGKTAPGAEEASVHPHVGKALTLIAKGKPIGPNKQAALEEAILRGSVSPGTGAKKSLSGQVQKMEKGELRRRKLQQVKDKIADEEGYTSFASMGGKERKARQRTYVNPKTGEEVTVPRLVDRELRDTTDEMLKMASGKGNVVNPKGLPSASEKESGVRLPVAVEDDPDRKGWVREKREKSHWYNALSRTFLEGEGAQERSRMEGKRVGAPLKGDRPVRGTMADYDVRNQGDPVEPGRVAMNVARAEKGQERGYDPRKPAFVEPRRYGEIKGLLTSIDKEMGGGGSLTKKSDDATEILAWVGEHAPQVGHGLASTHPSLTKAMVNRVDYFVKSLEKDLEKGTKWVQGEGGKKVPVPLTEQDRKNYTAAMKTGRMAQDVAPTNPAVAATLLKAFGAIRFDGPNQGAGEFLRRRGEAALAELYHIKGGPTGVTLERKSRTQPFLKYGKAYPDNEAVVGVANRTRYQPADTEAVRTGKPPQGKRGADHAEAASKDPLRNAGGVEGEYLKGKNDRLFQMIYRGLPDARIRRQGAPPLSSGKKKG